MAFGSDNDIKITLTLDSEGVVKELKQVGDGLETLERGAKDSGDKVTGLEGVFNSIGGKIVVFNQALDLAGRAFSAVSGAASTAFEAISRGSAVGDVSSSFDQLAQKAGVTAAVFQDQLVQATGATISNFELQKKAIESLRAGVKPDEFVTLTQAARALAEQTGGDTTDALNQLSQAFETGRVRALQNSLGIIDLEKAEQSLADKLGVAREQLNENGRVLAARNALLEASRKKVAELGDIEADAGDKISQFTTAIQNAKDRILEALSSNEALNRALSSLASTIQKLDFSPIINGLSKIISLAVKAAETLLNVAAAAAKAFNTTPAPVQQFEKSLNTLEEFSNKVKETTKALEDVGTSREAFEKLRPSIVELEKEYGKLYKTIKGAGASSLTDAYQNVIKVANGLDVALEKNKKATKETALSVDDLANKIKDAAQKTEPLKDPFGINAIVGVVDKALAESQEKVEEYNQRVADEAKAAQQQLSDQLEQNTADSLGASLDAALNGGKSGDYKNILRKFYSENFRALGEFFGGPIGGELAAVVGDKFGKLIFDGLNRVFGGRDAQGKIRDNLDKFFGELLKDNPALITFQGKLKQIFDLDFLRGSNAFTDGSFDDTLQGLSSSAIATFDGLALAFSQFVEGATEQTGQLSAVLANNLGGSLNNLQLFVQATGISFEQLREQVIQAFLDGKLTADETLNSLQSIEQIAQKGIPGALGAVDEAFNNLKAAGEKGGRALIDALQDIGVEARELGIKDFATLANVIREKTGASAEDVQKLFDALSASGITSIEQLQNATTEQLLPALSALGKTDFPFEKAAESVQGLIDQVDKLPDRIEKKLVFNVETRTDRNSQALIDKGAIPSFGNAGEGT